MPIHRLAVILGRAGSKGLPNKNVLSIAGRPMIAYTIDLARASREIDDLCVTTDAPKAAEAARAMGVLVIDRPAELATEVSHARQAVACEESRRGRVRRPA